MSQNRPVVKGVAYCLFHVPSLVRYGSKPAREIPKDHTLLASILNSQMTYEEAVAYPPSQAFIGNLRPDQLLQVPEPWFKNPVKNASRIGPYGEIVSEDQFLGLLKIADDFDLIWLEEQFVSEIAGKMEEDVLISGEDLNRLGKGMPMKKIEERISRGTAIPLYNHLDRVVGCVNDGHEEDAELKAHLILEGLACKASGFWALRHLLKNTGGNPDNISYVINCGEEATGDRYQRGGGSMGKAVAERAGCVNASGSDVKAYCCSPIHSVVMASGLVQSGIMQQVVVLGGGSLAKLGMKHKGHLKNGMPIIEELLASLAVLIGPDDGVNPVIRTDVVGKHAINAGDSPPRMMQALIVQPLENAGYKLTDIDKFALELHNPEVTKPSGSGDPALNNYKTIASIVASRGEIARDEIPGFIQKHGMPGYAPTQGHIPAALPFLGHARDSILENGMQRAMFVAKGSIFLGKMTTLSDGMSFLLERNRGY